MGIRNVALAAPLLLAFFCAVSPAADNADFPSEDARITGREMHSFTTEGEAVHVIVGDFAMTLGERRFSGRDAVLWIREQRVGQQLRRSYEIYIEGEAQVTEPGGTVTRDASMLVTAAHRGELRADVRLRSDRALADLPLYQRAAAVRRAAREAGPIRPGTPVVPPVAPAPTPTPSPQTQPEPPVEKLPLLPITYRADLTSPQKHEARWVVVCKGNVYIGYGDIDSSKYIEMRSQSAVLFTEAEKIPGGLGEEAQTEPSEVAVPAEQPSGPAVEELALGVPGRGDIAAIYLEGDVVLSQGDRVMRASRLYFDLRTDRAVILDLVMRAVQEDRQVPIYIRAEEARRLSSRETWFRDARISTSEFATPFYHVGASRGYVMDTTPYDQQGNPLDDPSFHLDLRNITYNFAGVPMLWWPWERLDAQAGDTPLRGLQAGQHGDFGLGLESEWYLFRLLGLVRPKGFDGTFRFDIYERGTAAGVDLDYARDDFTGYLLAYGVNDQGEDNFGRDLQDIPAPDWRGRLLWRHKQFLPESWELQFELSAICDKNFLQEYFRSEFWTGKDQDTLLYLRKQQDNWAFTSLIQGQINRFQTGQEAYPDFGFNLNAEPVGDALSLFSESHLGVVRYKLGNDEPGSSSDIMGRADQRLELDAPLHAGPLNVVPYIIGRGSYWSDSIDSHEIGRAYGAVGTRSNLSLWRLYDQAESRLFDIHRIRHIVTPEFHAFAAASNVEPDELWPISPDIEQHLQAFQGASLGVRQRWQTYRGQPGAMNLVDLVRFDLAASFFGGDKDEDLPSDGRWFWDRAEYSLVRNAVDGALTWNISDSTAFLADGNYDVDSGRLAIINVGLAVQRNPRLRYYLGLRRIADLDSSVGIIGFNYEINRIYQLRVFEKYDFDFNDGDNLSTEATIIRKLPRWFVALTFVADATEENNYGIILTLWPEGMPEVHIGSSRINPEAFDTRN